MDDCDRKAMVYALADLAGRRMTEAEAGAVLERYREIGPERANAIWAQHRRAPATVSFRDYLAMTIKFLDASQPR